ncbi:MAG: hypothetical protein R3B96_17135 [Pirellulaceae bacterium]
MQPIPLRTTVIGSYPFPGWLEYASQNLEVFGSDDLAEIQRDAVIAAVHDQLAAGLDVITDGEQTRLDFNLSFYGYLTGLDLEAKSPRCFGPPAHDQRGKHRIIGPLGAPRGLGAVEEFERLKSVAQVLAPEAGTELAGSSPVLKASVPGPFTLSGRLLPNDSLEDRWAIAEELRGIVARELERLVAAGCRELTVDEPSMSCYAYRLDPDRLVDLFNRTVESVAGRCRLSTHLCFGNFKGRAVGPRRYAPMFPAFLEMRVDEIHVEMASRQYAELELIATIAERKDVAVGVVDVKSYHIETPDEIAEAVRQCLRFAPAERLAFAPDCGLSQTARWAARQKLANMVAGVRQVREEMGQ